MCPGLVFRHRSCLLPSSVLHHSVACRWKLPWIRPRSRQTLCLTLSIQDRYIHRAIYLVVVKESFNEFAA
jgi:hypothetical protein